MERQISFKELQRHRSFDDCWVVVKNKVYDMSGFVESHPGGQQMILQNAGFDGTIDYVEAYHSEED